MPGFEHYDQQKHVLRALIPTTGTADAPRAFNMKLTKVLGAAEYAPTRADPELEVKHVVIPENPTRST